MSIPTHKLRVYKRVVNFFGSELEFVGAINRCVRDLNGRLWDSEETVEVLVPHDTWEALRDARGSLQLARLRNLIPLMVLDRVAEGRGNSRQPGTLMVAQMETICPYCARPVEPETIMVNTFAPDGSTKAVHLACANEAGVSYRAGPRLESGLRWLQEQAIRHQRFQGVGS